MTNTEPRARWGVFIFDPRDNRYVVGGTATHDTRKSLFAWRMRWVNPRSSYYVAVTIDGDTGKMTISPKETS